MERKSSTLVVGSPTEWTRSLTQMAFLTLPRGSVTGCAPKVESVLAETAAAACSSQPSMHARSSTPGPRMLVATSCGAQHGTSALASHPWLPKYRICATFQDLPTFPGPFRSYFSQTALQGSGFPSFLPCVGTPSTGIGSLAPSRAAVNARSRHVSISQTWCSLMPALTMPADAAVHAKPCTSRAPLLQAVALQQNLRMHQPFMH